MSTANLFDRINANESLKLDDVFTKIMNLDRKDFASPRKDLTLTQNPESGLYEVALKDEHAFPLSEYAREQMHHSLSPGLNTLSREVLSRDKPEYSKFYVDTVNEMFSLDGASSMIRTAQPGDERFARAFVSTAYKAIDDHMTVPNMVNKIGDHADKWMALGGQVTDSRTYLRFISRDPMLTMNINNRKRELHIGFESRNSEVGNGKWAFRAFFFDGYCMNGCVFGSINIADVSYVHRGSRISTEFGEIFANELQKQELINIQNTVDKAVQLAIDGAYVEPVRQLLEASVNRKFEDVDSAKQSDFIKAIAAKVGLTKTEQETALVHYDGGENAFAVQAAITRLAQDAKTFDRRVELEQAGGKVVEMADNTWNSIKALQAA